MQREEFSYLSYKGSSVDIPTSVVTTAGGGGGGGVDSELSVSLNPICSCCDENIYFLMCVCDLNVYKGRYLVLSCKLSCIVNDVIFIL